MPMPVTPKKPIVTGSHAIVPPGESADGMLATAGTGAASLDEPLTVAAPADTTARATSVISARVLSITVSSREAKAFASEA